MMMSPLELVKVPPRETAPSTLRVAAVVTLTVDPLVNEKALPTVRPPRAVVPTAPVMAMAPADPAFRVRVWSEEASSTFWLKVIFAPVPLELLVRIVFVVTTALPVTVMFCEFVVMGVPPPAISKLTPVPEVIPVTLTAVVPLKVRAPVKVTVPPAASRLRVVRLDTRVAVPTYSVPVWLAEPTVTLVKPLARFVRVVRFRVPDTLLIPMGVVTAAPVSSMVVP